MATGADARFGAAPETVYGTRVAPATWFSYFTSPSIAYNLGRYESEAIGGGAWTHPTIRTTERGEFTFGGEVPTAGFGWLLDKLHAGATTITTPTGGTLSRQQIHTMAATPPPTGKSFSFQVLDPPVQSATLIPIDFIGGLCSGITLSWTAAAVLTFELTGSFRQRQTGLAAGTPSVADHGLFSFKGGSLSIGGTAVTEIFGDGSLNMQWSQREAYALGSGGLQAPPVPDARPTAGGSFTADFNDLVLYNLAQNDSQADVVLKFEGATIEGAIKETVEFTIPDCRFDSSMPVPTGYGPVSQDVTFTASSGTGNAPVIRYVSTDTSL